MSEASVLKIGHRGACGYEPENTMRSFQKALDIGVDIVEMDVYVCKSGQLVVIHDHMLDRTTDGYGYVEEKTLDELKQLDAGKGEKIPTLPEALSLINRKAKVYIELKGFHTAGPVAQIIEQYVQEKSWRYEDFIVASFNHVELTQFHTICPSVPLATLIVGIPVGLAQFAQDVGAKYLVAQVGFLNQELIDDAHARGIKVIVFTVNKPEEISRVKALGVDGIVSNYPNLI